jgi:hypothetical protein
MEFVSTKKNMYIDRQDLFNSVILKMLERAEKEEYKKKHPSPKGVSFSLKNLTKRVLGVDISKEEQTSNWFVRPLRDEQLKYAYMDSELAMVLYEKFEYFEIPFEEDENKLENLAQHEEYMGYGVKK